MAYVLLKKFLFTLVFLTLVLIVNIFSFSKKLCNFFLILYLSISGKYLPLVEGISSLLILKGGKIGSSVSA